MGAVPMEKAMYHPLRNSTCFSPSNLALITNAMTRQRFASGTFIFLENDLSNKWYFVFKGRIKLLKQTEEGKEFILHIFEEGDFFGQTVFSKEQKHIFRAQALETAELGIMHTEELESILCQNYSLACEYVEWQERVRMTAVTKMRDLFMYGKSGALCSVLIRLANTYGVEHPHGIRIPLKFTNVELADYIGCARESVSRMISQLKKNGAVNIENGGILIRDMDYLKNVCHCDDCPKEICRI